MEKKEAWQEELENLQGLLAEAYRSGDKQTIDEVIKAMEERSKAVEKNAKKENSDGELFLQRVNQVQGGPFPWLFATFESVEREIAGWGRLFTRFPR